MDIDNIAPEIRTIEIVHPGTREKLGIAVDICSIDDPRMKTLRRNIQNKAIQLQQRGKSFTAEEVEENQINIAAAMIVGWNWYGDATMNGQKPEYSAKNVRAILTEKRWFLKQVAEAIDDQNSFFLK